MLMWLTNLNTKTMRTLKKGDPDKTIAAKKEHAEKKAARALEYINGIDKRLAESFYAVEADSYAYHMIWKEYFYDVTKEKRKYDFVQDNSGIGHTIGMINKRPVVLQFNWWIINGHRILFYSVCSQIVDWKMVEEWLKKNMLHLKETSDATNVHNVLRHCEKPEPKKVERIIKCYTCNDSKQVEVNRIGYDSIMGHCPNC